MFILLGILAYIVCGMLFCAWDAFIGLPVEFDGYDNPPLGLVACFWPIATPVMIMMGFAKFLKRVKEKRIDKEEKMERVRIAAQREMDTYLVEVEQELKNYARKGKNAA